MKFFLSVIRMLDRLFSMRKFFISIVLQATNEDERVLDRVTMMMMKNVRNL